MSGSGKGGWGLSGSRQYIIGAAWLVLVVVGGFCTWYGWFGPGGGEEPVAQATEVVEAAAESVIGEDSAPASDPQEQATAALTPLLPTVATGDEPFGYGIVIHGAGGGNVEYMMGQVDSLGLGWVKQQVRWADIERNPGEMEWGTYDWIVESANEKGLKLMFSVVDAPTWLRSSYLDDNVEGAPPDNLADYADFIGKLVDRYEGRIHAIEVWNEQNLDREWDTAEGINPELYVEMLRLSYQAIKSRDPNIIVISGALSPAAGPWTDPNNSNRITVMDDFEYFDRMIAAGFLNSCDCVGAHHNGINMPPDVAWDEGYSDSTAKFRGPFDNPHHSWSFKSTLWGYHDRVAAAGAATPLCITEFGWATSEGFEGFPPQFEFALDNTLADQAEWDVQAFQLLREWGFVRLAFLWNLNYSQLGWGPEDPNAPYAITDFAGAARPAFDAIGAMEKP
ncbi:MAG: hypothetical protein MUQ10_04820 [Anaerolineae bacterium]|nr:hypothetical protein [Anaerolineae bacterium]